MAQENMEDELKKIAPDLFKQRQQGDGLQVPEGYFEGLEDRVFARIEAAKLRRPTPMKIQKSRAKRFSLPRIYMAAAAALVLVLSAIWFFQPGPTTSAPVAAVELSEEEIENYVLENVQDFEAEQLVVLPDEAENDMLAPTELTPSKSADPLDNLRPEDVEDILNDMTDEELEDIL
jgi:hypothetical protein